MKHLLAVLLLLWAAPLFAQLETADVPLADPRAEAQARSLMAELRCLQCQNQSIADSNAPQATSMRAIVREQVAAGTPPNEIRGWFIERYGDWVSFAPPARPDTFLLWAAPLLALLGGGLIVWRLFRRKA